MLPERQQSLEKAIASLTGNHSFDVFLSEVNACREDAVRDASRLELIESPSKLASVMGEVRAYQQILDLYRDRASVD